MWKKAQSSFRYVKIALCVIAVYFLILSLFAQIFQTNKKNIYTNTSKNVAQKSANEIRSFITDKEINKTKVGKLAVIVVKGITCSFIGENCYENLDKKNLSNVSTFIASVFAYPFVNPPASGVGATVQTLARAGIIPKSYAAEGVGFASISPLMNAWKALRDVSYLVLVLVIVTIGFMIMLRTKINPQTVVKVENSLPKIVVTLIYITFSFAIAGFLIDIMYVAIVLIIAILGPLQTTRTTENLMQILLQAHPGQIIDILFNFNFFNIFWLLPTALINIMGGLFAQIFRILVSLFISMYFIYPQAAKIFHDTTKDIDAQGQASAVVASVTLVGIVKAIVSTSSLMLTLVLSLLIGPILVPLVLGLIIFLTILLVFFRIFLLLFSNYIKLLVLIIISPLYLLMEAIPGQSTFVSWIKNLLELLVPFPVIIAAFLIGSIIMGASTSGNLWTPPFLSQLNSEYLSAIIGMWVLFMIPDFIGIAQKAINPKPLPLDAGLGTFFGGAKTGVETGLGEMSKYALLSQQFTPLGRVFDMIPGFKKK